MNPCEGVEAPAGFSAAVFSLGNQLTVSVVKSPTGPVPLLWSAEECIRIRLTGRIAVSPVGQCPVKIESNGKAAAVPAILSDEELCLVIALGWAKLVDATSGAELAPSDVLAASLAASPRPPNDVRLRRIAFLDLWAKGYRMTSGIKFGVDWLTYRGDPTSCHAAFMVTVLAAGAPVAPLDLIARSRVATTALKICALAYVQLPSGTAPSSVSYQAFRRMGVGSAVFDPAQRTTADVLRATQGLSAALEAFGMSLEPTAVEPPPALVAAAAASAARAEAKEATEVAMMQAAAAVAGAMHDAPEPAAAAAEGSPGVVLLESLEGEAAAGGAHAGAGEEEDADMAAQG